MNELFSIKNFNPTMHSFGVTPEKDKSLGFECDAAVVNAKVDELSRFALEGLTISLGAFVGLHESCKKIKANVQSGFGSTVLCSAVYVVGVVPGLISIPFTVIIALAVESVKAAHLKITHTKQEITDDAGQKHMLYYKKADVVSNQEKKDRAGFLSLSLYNNWKDRRYEGHYRNSSPVVGNLVKSLFLYSGQNEKDSEKYNQVIQSLMIQSLNASGQGAIPQTTTVGGVFISVLSDDLPGDVQELLRLFKGTGNNLYEELKTVSDHVKTIVQTESFLMSFLKHFVNDDVKNNDQEDYLKEARGMQESRNVFQTYEAFMANKDTLNVDDLKELNQILEKAIVDEGRFQCDFIRLKTAVRLFIELKNGD